MLFDDETSQTDEKLILLAPDVRIVAQKNKFSVNFFDEFSGRIFIMLCDIIPNVFEISGGGSRDFNCSRIILLKRHVFLSSVE